MSKHTPGPWKIGERVKVLPINTKNGFRYRVGETGRVISCNRTTVIVKFPVEFRGSFLNGYSRNAIAKQRGTNENARNR